MTFAWELQAITWANVDLSPKMFCGTYVFFPKAISQRMPKLLFYKKMFDQSVYVRVECGYHTATMDSKLATE